MPEPEIQFDEYDTQRVIADMERRAPEFEKALAELDEARKLPPGFMDFEVTI